MNLWFRFLRALFPLASFIANGGAKLLLSRPRRHLPEQGPEDFRDGEMPPVISIRPESTLPCRPARDGGPSCVTTHRTLPPWTCSLFQLSVSTCSMPWSSSGWTAETSSGSTSQQIPRPNGLHVKITEAFPWDEAPHYLI